MTRERAVLNFGLSEIERMANELGLPMNIKETAFGLYRKAIQKGLVRRRSVESISSAALYIACRKHRAPRTLKEIADASKSPLKEVRLSYSLLVRELGIKLEPVNPKDYVFRFCSRLNLEDSEESKAVEIIERAEKELMTSGRKPAGTAVAAIYIAATLAGNGKCRNQEEIHSVTGVNPVTLRNRCVELLETLSEEEQDAFDKNLHAHIRRARRGS